jgi:methyl-accepting chemotaxis protein
LDAISPEWKLQANRDRYAHAKSLLPSLREAEEAAMKRAASGERDAVAAAGNELTEKAVPINNAIKGSLGEMADSFDVLMQRETEQIRAQGRSMDITMGINTMVAVGIGIFVAVFLSRNIARASHSVLEQAEAIASGDLTRDDLQVQSHDELGDLTLAINKMSGSLKRMIHAITDQFRWQRK